MSPITDHGGRRCPNCAGSGRVSAESELFSGVMGSVRCKACDGRGVVLYTTAPSGRLPPPDRPYDCPECGAHHPALVTSNVRDSDLEFLDELTKTTGAYTQNDIGKWVLENLASLRAKLIVLTEIANAIPDEYGPGNLGVLVGRMAEDLKVAKAQMRNIPPWWCPECETTTELLPSEHRCHDGRYRYRGDER